MPRQIHLLDLLTLLSAQPYYLDSDSSVSVITGITTDTRRVQTGEVFIALQGANFDGHGFAGQAIEAGAQVVITNRRLPEKIPQLVVPDTLVAYQRIAQWWRQQFQIPVIGVTGSFGKTTTKELIAALLSHHGKVLKTQLNYNNEIGVPKTLLELNADHQFAVVEMAMRGLGEIALLTQITQPTIGLITIAGSAHVGRLGSLEAIAQAKCELLEEMPGDGVAILNHDSQRLLDRAAAVWSGNTITYGLEGGDLQGKLQEDQLIVRGKSLPLPLPGRHNAVNFLGAIAVAETLGLDWDFLTHGLPVQLPSGRAQRYQLSQDILLLDETYNAGLESMIAALHLLAGTPGKRHVAVLGTMKELGEKSQEFHHRVGEVVRELALDQLFVLVDAEGEAEAIAQGADPLKALCFNNHADLTTTLQSFLQPGDTVLLKASRSVKLDLVVDRIKEERDG
ncbi:MAG: UDP-N-acetylmuramoyl-tripeptide--D-alanyl-D-alanine ligase [Coleofasciculaceae cyanobacterium SM2_1_6]|nr:UDP-N-acetylmuramoyl-tripeptide--D-alanyl-D-alanine ligase [Coleofasciculaceae cyanobacterium SM2_1_6]